MEVFFDKKTLGESLLAGDRGKLKILDEDKVSDIEDIIIRMYQERSKTYEKQWKSAEMPSIKNMNTYDQKQRKKD